MIENDFIRIPEFSDQYYSQNIDYQLIKKIGTYVIELSNMMESKYFDSIGEQCEIVQSKLSDYFNLINQMQNQLILQNQNKKLVEFQNLTKIKPSTINGQSKYYMNNFIMKNFDRNEQLIGRFDWISRANRLRSQEINSISDSFYNFE